MVITTPWAGASLGTALANSITAPSAANFASEGALLFECLISSSSQQDNLQ